MYPRGGPHKYLVLMRLGPMDPKFLAFGGVTRMLIQSSSHYPRSQKFRIHWPEPHQNRQLSIRNFVRFRPLGRTLSILRPMDPQGGPQKSPISMRLRAMDPKLSSCRKSGSPCLRRLEHSVAQWIRQFVIFGPMDPQGDPQNFPISMRFRAMDPKFFSFGKSGSTGGST